MLPEVLTVLRKPEADELRGRFATKQDGTRLLRDETEPFLACLALESLELDVGSLFPPPDATAPDASS